MKKPSSYCRFAGRALAAVILTAPLAVAPPAAAKDYDPYVMYVFPAGGQRGTTVEIFARGRGLEGASEVRISGPGITAKVLGVEEPDTKLRQRSKNRLDQSENPNIVRMSLTIAPDAELGQRDLRLVTPKGVTNRRAFVVGQVPEILEVEPEGDDPTEPQAIDSLPVVINGQIDQADRDIFRFTAKAGQTVVCDFQGQRLLPYIADAVPGWLQACLTLYDADGNELAYVDDFRFHPDPVLIFTVESDGEYMIEARDVLFRGREDLVYRLTVGAVPFVTHLYPLGAKRGSQAQVELNGVNLPKPTTTVAVDGNAPPVREVKVNGGSLATNALPFAAGDLPEAQETEPNNTPEEAQEIELPVTVNGRIGEAGDIDCFRIAAKAKQRLVLDVWARRLDSPLDSLLTVFDGNGRQLAENDDTADPSQGLETHHADSYLNYVFPADGDYVVRLADVQSLGGEEYAYRLSIAPPRPDFDLRVFPANVSIQQGGTALVKVKAYRRDGFGDEIPLSAGGLPGGCVPRGAVVPAGQNEVRLTITAAPDAPLGVVSPTFQGKATVGDAEVVRTAGPGEEMMQAFYYYHDVLTDEMLLDVVAPRDLALSADFPADQVFEVALGGTVDVKIKAARTGESKQAVKLAAEAPPRGITVKAATIAPDQNETTITITVTKQVSVGSLQNVILAGTMRVEKDNITRFAPAIPIRVVAAPK